MTDPDQPPERDDDEPPERDDDDDATAGYGGASDHDDDAPDDSADAPGEDEDREPADGPAGRDVEVPMDVYKAVTVFSTLFAVLFVLAGFVILDVATQRATAPVDEIRLPLALLGLGSIGAGAAVYAFSTRFRARGMGKPKDGADQPSDDG